MPMQVSFLVAEMCGEGGGFRSEKIGSDTGGGMFSKDATYILRYVFHFTPKRARRLERVSKYRWVPVNSKLICRVIFLSNELNFEIREQISIAEIGVQFLYDLNYPGNWDYPYSD